MDELIMFDFSVSNENMDYMYNGGAGRNLLSASTPTAPTVIINSPSNESILSVTPALNFTPTIGSSSLDSAEVWTNYNGTWALVATNSSLSSGVVNSVSWCFGSCNIDGEYLINVKVNDTSGAFVWGVNTTFFIDTTDPLVTLDGSSIWTNVSYGLAAPFLASSSFITGQVNVSDTNLFSFNISIVGQRVLYNTTGITAGILSYDLNEDISDLAAGKYVLRVYVADGHTARSIEEYDYKRGLNSVQFDFPKRGLFNDDYISIDVEGITGSLDVTKQFDRYNFDYSSLTNKNELVFYVTSNHYIAIVPKSSYGYPGHLIIEGIDNGKGKWIDFKLKPEFSSGNEVYVTERVGRNEVKVTISNLSGRHWEFESIGDLNTVTNDYSFYVINATETYVSPVLDGSSNQFKLNFTMDTGLFDASTFLDYDSVLYSTTKLNGSGWQSFTKTVTAPEIGVSSLNIPFFWNFSLQSNSMNISNVTTSQNQTVQQLIVQSCSLGGTLAKNFTFEDENTFVRLLNVSTEFIIDYSYNGITRNATGSTVNTDQSAICISPASANFTASQVLLQYQPFDGAYETKEYVNQFENFDNVSESIIAYSLLSSSASAITITLRDENDALVSNGIIKAYRLNLSNDVFYLAESELTDINGQSLFSLVADTAFYKFQVYVQGQQRLETDAFKLTQAAYTLRIGGNNNPSPLTELIGLRKIGHNLTYNNNTHAYTFTWNDPTPIGDSFCLEVNNATDNLNLSCSTAASGSLSYQIVQAEGTFTSVGYVVVNGGKRILDIDGVSLGGLAGTLGKGLSLIFTFLIVLVMFLLGLSSPRLSVATGIVASIFAYLLQIVPFSLSQVIGIICLGAVMWVLMKDGGRG